MNHPPNNDNDNADNGAVAPGIAAVDDHDGDGDDDDDILDPAEIEQICTEAMTLLQNRLNFHSKLRDRTMVRFAQQFIRNVKNDIHQTITDTRTIEEGYDGLDIERDTEEEVEKAIRSCPEVLTQRDERFQYYPFRCLTFMQNDNDDQIMRNVKAVSFIPLFVQLAIEFNSFPNEERGGLLIEDNRGHNVLHDLVETTHLSRDEEHQQRVDTTFLAVLIRLRRSGYFLKNDIQHYGLVHKVCQRKYFSEHRFRFLTEWDPPSLLRTNANHDNELPLHWVTTDLPSFRGVLDSLFRFYPRWKGINALFTIDNDGDTPFQLACEELTRTKVMEVVEEILVRYTTNNGLVNNNNNGNAMILAASDDSISLDGLFFLIRRQPTTMLSMLRHRHNNRIMNRNSNDFVVNSTASDNNNNMEDSSSRHNKNNRNTGDTNNDNHGSNIEHNTVSVLRRSTRKRKNRY